MTSYIKVLEGKRKMWSDCFYHVTNVKIKKEEMKQAPAPGLLPGKSLPVTRRKEFLGNNNFRRQKEIAQLSAAKAVVLITQQQARDMTRAITSHQDVSETLVITAPGNPSSSPGCRQPNCITTRNGITGYFYSA